MPRLPPKTLTIPNNSTHHTQETQEMKTYALRTYNTLLLALIMLLAMPATTITASTLYQDDEEEESVMTLPVHFYDRAQKEFGKQRWNRGKEIIDAGLKRFPDDSNLNTLAGRYWVHHEQWDKARFHLVKAINEYYNNVEAKQMLVSVEDITGNYSSAICYINELLEINPYWEGLWRKKIELYKKQGNTYEANRLFKRLQQIYPKNQEIKDAYYYELELEYAKQNKAGNLVAKGDALRELTKLNPKNVDYQLVLINHYYNANLMDKAIDQASLALAENPGNIEILRKKVAILEENGRHNVAIARVKSFIDNGHNTVEARRLYDELMLMTARKGRQDDPYVIYGKIFEKNRNHREALDFLINTAITQRYDQDAIYYLKEGKRVYGMKDKKIRYKEYDFYKARGNHRQANDLLEKLHEDFPEDYDISYLYCQSRLEKAEQLMENKNYADALAELRKIEKKNIDPELTYATYHRIFTCLIQEGKYHEAQDAFEYIKPQLALHDADLKQSQLLYGLGNKDNALDHLYTALANLEAAPPVDSTLRQLYIGGIEEMSVPYIKELINMGQFDKAYILTQKLLEYDPNNYYGLLYSINLAGHLGDTEVFEKYTAQAYEYYPYESVFVLKQVSVHNSKGEHQQAIDMLVPKIHQYSGNTEYVNAYVASSELLAQQQAQADKYDKAIATLDQALQYSPGNKSLLYNKGLVYEYKQQYDSAYQYQKYYEPSALEAPEHISKLKGFRYKGNRNHIDIEYMQARFSEADVLTSVASIGYTRKQNKNTYSARLNYSGRNGSLFWSGEESTPDGEKGGVGMQCILGYDRKFNNRWTGHVSLGVGGSYFPKFIANLGATCYFKNDWYVDASAGYRRLMGSANLFSLSVAGNKELPHWLFTLGGGGIMYNSGLFFNLQAKARYMPLTDGRTSITAAAGFGTAPELNIIDLYTLSSSFSHMNSFASLGGQYLVTPNLSLGVLGVWNTVYDQKLTNTGEIATQYRNLYNAYVQVYISF